ncbi:acyl-coenzyme A thioesterase 9, mitochondrial, partial [Aplysia californica]|uniref:Acyl-coenzyme A thioesterase 9, mitochondrial n=1 Tax=Aplysia californica TaxID=6500 RepID=A0ABM1AA90_APLCA
IPLTPSPPLFNHPIPPPSRSGETVDPDQGVLQAVTDSQEELPKRTPQDSFAQAVIPLGRDPSARESYLTFARGIRFGRLLENFDTFAGLICYRHNLRPELGDNQKSPYSFVTALVDRIELSPTAPVPSPFKDIFMSGNVTWVGRSSMECTMHMEQEHNGSLQHMITAKYLFVARNPMTKKAAVVNPLLPQTPQEIELFKLGEANKKLRQSEGQKSLLKSPPTEDERLIIHDIFLSTIDLQSGTFKLRVKPKNTVWMDETILKSLIVCHPEQRNLYNKIFGGFLMRKAYELAWTNASLYTNTRPRMCKIVDDILFLKPVEIGDLLFLSSQIVYSKGQDLQVHVHAEVVNPDTDVRQTTNDFHFTFDTGLPDLPQVLPKTYAESMLYLVGKRHMES